MQTKWIFSSTFLPYTGEPIEFMLEDRKQAIHGTFANGIFHSRWADYDVDRVQSWRGSDGDPTAEAIETPKVIAGRGFIMTLKRLSRVLTKGRNAAPVAPVRSHARLAILPPPSVPVPAAPVRRIDSNQISS